MLSSAVLFALIVISGCALNEDVSDHPIDTKLASCFLRYGIDNLSVHGETPISHAIQKKCIIRQIDARRQSGQDLSDTLTDMGFVCSSSTQTRCVLNSKQRMYGMGVLAPDYSRYSEVDSVVHIGASGDRITSLQINKQSRGADGKISEPIQTDNSVPNATQSSTQL